MEMTAPTVLIRQDEAVTGGNCPPGGRHVKAEPRAHVHVTGLAPVKVRMRKQDLSSAKQQSQKSKRSEPVSHAHKRGVAPTRSHTRKRFGRRGLVRRPSSDRQNRIHRSPIPRWRAFYSYIKHWNTELCSGWSCLYVNA